MNYNTYVNLKKGDKVYHDPIVDEKNNIIIDEFLLLDGNNDIFEYAHNKGYRIYIHDVPNCIHLTKEDSINSYISNLETQLQRCDNCIKELLELKKEIKSLLKLMSNYQIKDKLNNSHDQSP